MNNKKGQLLPIWLLLPVLSCSCAVLANDSFVDDGSGVSTLSLEDDAPVDPSVVNRKAAYAQAPSAVEQAAEIVDQNGAFSSGAAETSSVNSSYVGGNTRIGVGIDTEFKGRIDATQVFSDTKSSVTSGDAWVGFNPKAKKELDENKLTGAGVQLNHNWVGTDSAGNPDVVHKVFGAYDQNQHKDKKVTAGYGQETESMFWSAQGSLAKGDQRSVGTGASGNTVYEKPYDYGVGLRAGTFLPDELMRIQAGLDAEWAKKQNDIEKKAGQVTISAGVEKFFADSPHSVGANVEVYKKTGGYTEAVDGEDTKDGVKARGNVSYRYEFGNNGVYESNQTYRRVRTEIPGNAGSVSHVQRKLVRNIIGLENTTMFTGNNAQLSREAQECLQGIIARIREAGHQGNIRITGMSNGVRTRSEKNDLILSNQRAHAVRNFLISQGFDPDQIIAEGVGYSAERGYQCRLVDIEFMTQSTQARAEEIRSEPQVVWTKELVKGAPNWVSQALRNNIQHKRTIDTYRTLGSFNTAEEGNTLKAEDDVAQVEYNSGPNLIAIAVNDHKPDNAGVTAVVVTQPAHGTVTFGVVNGEAVAYYTPNATYSGTDSFTYHLVDAQGNVSNDATVNISVSSCTSKTCINAANDVFSITLNDTSAKTLNVLFNDTGDTLKIVSVSAGKYGTAQISADGKSIIYNLRYGYCNSEDLVYIVEDKYGNRQQAMIHIDVN